jgi:hypothetical protein
MAVLCPHCKRGYDSTLFEYGKTVICDCGTIVRFQHEENLADRFAYTCNSSARFSSRKQEDMMIMEVKRLADNISFLIVSTDYPDIDIEIEKNNLRELIDRFFPEKNRLYDLIYEPRFRRLKEQFRNVR